MTVRETAPGDGRRSTTRASESAGQSRASAHGGNCNCARCVGFLPGNEYRVGEGNAVAVSHGSYALIDLAPEARETAALIAELVPLSDKADVAAIELLAVTLKQVERASKALEEASAAGKRGELARLSQDAQGWVNRALGVCEALGMTPRSRMRLGLDLTRARALEREPVADLSALSPPERVQLHALLDRLGLGMPPSVSGMRALARAEKGLRGE